ncbi:MAG: hypothetical protein NZ925_02295, partial [Sulfolobales archaeon]|nr:hypothetical protein [Sulfolobales archaeon]
MYEVVSRPKDFFSLLPISAEFRSFRGSDLVVHLSAFGLKGDAVFSFAASKKVNRVIVESSLIGELIMGFFRPPRTDLNFRLLATRIGEETEITFELYIKAGAFRERVSGLASEAEKFISSIPKSITEALRQVAAKPAVEVRREEAVVSSLPTTSVIAVSERGVPPAEAEKREEKRGLARTPAVPIPSVESAKPVGRAVSDTYLGILEDPVAIYRLTIGGKSIATLRMKYSSVLMNVLSDIST